jgi:hypothetical protein
MVKYKCVKIECPVCGSRGSCQLFLNKDGRLTYARARNYKGKGKFSYCKIEDLEALKTSRNGQGGQGQTTNNIDPKLKDSNLFGEVEPRAGFDPATITLPR